MCKTKNYPLAGFVDRLNDTLYATELSKAQLAKKIKVSRTTAFNYFDGISEPPASVLGKMCKILNVSADYLLFGKQNIKEE